MIKIRRANNDDVKFIFDLEQEYMSQAWTQNQIEDSMKNALYSFYVGECEEKRCAYGAINWCLDEGNVCNIITDKSFRNRGLAKSILNNMEIEAKTRFVSKLFLEVNEKNYDAISLYQKMGFTELSRRANYYGKDTAIIMMKRV